MGIFAELFERAKANAAKPPPRAEMARIAVPTRRPAAARVLVHGVPVRQVEQSTRRTAAEQARYDREQAANTRRVIAETTAIAAYYARGEAYLARQEAEASARAKRQFAHSVLRAGAKLRGETYDPSRYAPGPSQAGYPGDTGDCE